MNRHLSGLIFAVGLICVATGCNLHLTGANEVNPTAMALAKTALSRTEAAKTVEGVLESPDAPLPATLTATPTITLTPTVTQTPTPEKVTITVSKNTNCRTGPEKQFDLVGIIKTGETAEAIGRNAQKTYWVIRLPSNTAKTCWLWYEWATLTGNGDTLPIVESPPTPTWSPKPDFTFSFVAVINCPTPRTIKLQVTNTGNVAWESYRLEARDLTTDEDASMGSNDFPGFPACGWSSGPAIQPGGSSFAIGPSPVGSSGHSVLVTLHLYTENNGHGTHMQGDFTFTMSML